MRVTGPLAAALRRLLDGRNDAAMPELVFGPSRREGDRTVIPVTAVRATGEHGGEAVEQQLGTIIVRGDEADFVPAAPRRAVARWALPAAIALTALLALLSLARRRSS